MDPVALRLKNHADVEPDNGKAWSSKSLKEVTAPEPSASAGRGARVRDLPITPDSLLEHA